MKALYTAGCLLISSIQNMGSDVGKENSNISAQTEQPSGHPTVQPSNPSAVEKESTDISAQTEQPSGHSTLQPSNPSAVEKESTDISAQTEQPSGHSTLQPSNPSTVEKESTDISAQTEQPSGHSTLQPSNPSTVEKESTDISAQTVQPTVQPSNPSVVEKESTPISVQIEEPTVQPSNPLTLGREKKNLSTDRTVKPSSVGKKWNNLSTERPVNASTIGKDRRKILAQQSVNPPTTGSEKNQISVPSSHLHPHFLQIGGDYTHVNIKPHSHSSFNGSLGGIQAIYEYKPLNHIYGALKCNWRQGNAHGSHANRFLLDIDVQERIGYTFGFDVDKWSLSLFSGFGYRHLGHHLKTMGSTIRLNYNEFYFPVGLLGEYRFNGLFALGLYGTWMPQVYPNVTITPLKGARWFLTNTFANFLVELPFIFTLMKNKNFIVTVNPSFEHWQDGHSTAKSQQGISLGLPGNTYIFWSVDLNFGYAF
jgi:hypothetical protein